MSFMLLGILNSQAAGGGAGAYDLLETTTLTSSASSVTFSGLGSYSDYAHLQIRGIARGDRSSNTRGALSFNINGDTGGNYAWHYLRGDGSSVTSNRGVSASRMQYLWEIPAVNATANQFSSATIDFLDFSNTNKNTTMRLLQGIAGADNQVGIASGLWNNTSAVTSIDIIDLFGNLVSGSRLSLYGIKGA